MAIVREAAQKQIKLQKSLGLLDKARGERWRDYMAVNRDRIARGLNSMGHKSRKQKKKENVWKSLMNLLAQGIKQ